MIQKVKRELANEPPSNFERFGLWLVFFAYRCKDVYLKKNHGLA